MYAKQLWFPLWNWQSAHANGQVHSENLLLAVKKIKLIFFFLVVHNTLTLHSLILSFFCELQYVEETKSQRYL